MNSFAKLKDGTWGIRVEGPTPAVGDRVSVVKRDGRSTIQTIVNVVWTDGKMSLCTIAAYRVERNSKVVRYGCGCSESCCDRGCHCSNQCNCRGGNIYDC